MEIEDSVSLERDIVQCPSIVAKCKNDNAYAQNLYAALCNIIWYKTTAFLPVLKGDNEWSCTWRYAGGLVARIRDNGEDYMDWYCSGIAGGDEPDVYNEGVDLKRKGYVPEGEVADQIAQDLKELGWLWKEYED